MPDGGIGAPTKRREDTRFLTGRGKYTDDFTPQNTSYCAFARSQVANGKINGVDMSAAAEMIRCGPTITAIVGWSWRIVRAWSSEGTSNA